MNFFKIIIVKKSLFLVDRFLIRFFFLPFFLPNKRRLRCFFSFQFKPFVSPLITRVVAMMLVLLFRHPSHRGASSLQGRVFILMRKFSNSQTSIIHFSLVILFSTWGRTKLVKKKRTDYYNFFPVKFSEKRIRGAKINRFPKCH